ncbi:MAG: hypothetical protein R3301_15710 [Saprospiraceae bacterium]|nr:hypothetical protein [Saprospiraceae bacterium]
MKRIVALGLFVEGFGFTNVLTALFKQLKRYYHIDWVALAHRGPQIDRGYLIHPSNLQGGDMYGAYQGEALARSTNADYVLILNDVWMFKNYRKTHGASDRTWKTIAYVPLDGEVTETAWLSDVAFVDALAAYTPGDARQYHRAFRALHDQGAIDRFPALTHMPHGVDTNVYHCLPVEEKNALRRTYFPDCPADALIVLNANRFNERKNLKATLAGFAAALPHAERPLRLCLHLPGLAAHHRKELDGWVATMGLGDHLILNPLGDAYVASATLNALYNCCDIGVNTSHGEGWGLISFEHAAAGGAQIVPQHSAPASIWEHAALFLSRTDPCMIPNNPFRMYHVSSSDLTQHLVALANDRGLLVEWQERSRAHACRPDFDWAVIADRWYHFLEGL